MKKTFLFLLAILILPFALAYPITIQLNGNMNFNTAVYHCSDLTCSTLGPLYTSGSGNPINYNIDNEGAGTQYFAEYDYVSDRCYVSHSYKNWFDESIGNGPWQYLINFVKRTACKADINSVSFASGIYDNQTQQITANAKSPLNLNQQGPQAIPAALQYYYSTGVSVILEVRNQSNFIHTQTLSQNISWSSSRDFAFTLPLLQAGDYDITIKTKINDCMCSNYVEQTQTGTFTVLPQPNPPQPPQNQTNQAPTTNFTFSPQNPLINEVVTFDASLSSDSDGGIISYSWNFGDSATATGITAQHAYTTAGNYSVALTITDDDNAQSTLVKVIQILSQANPPQPPQNQTNQTQLSQNQTSTKIKPCGSVENIDLNELITTNEFCNKKGKITIALYNDDGKIKDIYVNFKIPKLSISVDSEEFDMAKHETKYIDFEFTTSKGGVYQSIISVYSKNSHQRLVREVVINCKEQPLQTSVIPAASVTGAATFNAASIQTQAGITGNAVAIVLKSNAWGMIAVLSIFILIEVLVLFFRFWK